VDGVCRTESLKVYDEIMNKTRRKWESEVVEKCCAGQYVDHISLRNNPDNYILCFSFFDMKHLLDIKPNDGSYIYSACEAFNEKMEIDFRRLWQWLRRFNISPYGFSMEKGVGGDNDLTFDRRYHASGHASCSWAAKAAQRGITSSAKAPGLKASCQLLEGEGKHTEAARCYDKVISENSS
jgi:ribonuclease J